jgi:hypothetical protein
MLTYHYYWLEAMALGYALTELLYTDLSSGLTNWI